MGRKSCCAGGASAFVRHSSFGQSNNDRSARVKLSNQKEFGLVPRETRKLYKNTDPRTAMQIVLRIRGGICLKLLSYVVRRATSVGSNCSRGVPPQIRVRG